MSSTELENDNLIIIKIFRFKNIPHNSNTSLSLSFVPVYLSSALLNTKADKIIPALYQFITKGHLSPLQPRLSRNSMDCTTVHATCNFSSLEVLLPLWAINIFFGRFSGRTGQCPSLPSASFFMNSGGTAICPALCLTQNGFTNGASFSPLRWPSLGGDASVAPELIMFSWISRFSSYHTRTRAVIF